MVAPAGRPAASCFSARLMSRTRPWPSRCRRNFYAPSIAEANGKLVITQTPAIQRKIREYIVSLRAECLPQVAVRCLAVAVPDEVAAGIRRRASIECFNISGLVCTPEVTTDMWGWLLDARTLLSPDRKGATVELRLTLPGSRRTQEETVAAQVAPASGGHVRANRITVPSGQVMRIQDCVSVPVGKYVLAGTFRRTGEEAKAAPNVLVLVRVEVVGAKKPE
jgi:hypothetical protein